MIFLARRSFAAITDLTFIYASRIGWNGSFRTSFARFSSFPEFYFTSSRMAIICKYVQIPDIPFCFFLPRQTDLNLKTCFWVCVCHKNAFSTSFTVRSTLFLKRDLLKKRVIYLFIHSTASGCSVLASAGDGGPPLSSQEVAALAECTVLSHLRDLLNSNVSRLRQKPGLQYCLNLHSKPGRVSRTAIFWTVCGFLVPVDGILRSFIYFFWTWHTWRMCIDRFKNNIPQFSPVGCAIHFWTEKSFRKLCRCSNLSKVCIKKKKIEIVM